MRKIFGILGILVLFVMIFLSSHTVLGATVIGVSPGTVEFKEVLRGGYAERNVAVTADSDEPLSVNVTARGEIEEWLNFSSGFTTSRDNPGQLFVSVSPPEDIPNGIYTGFLRIATGTLDSENTAGHAAVVQAVIDLSVSVEITDIEVFSCRAQSFSVSSAEQGDEVIFSLDLLNKGNIRIRPEVVVNIWNQEQTEIVKTESFSLDHVLPTKEEKLGFEMSSNDLGVDQYWVDVSVPDCFASETLTFDVLEPGALKSEGFLRKLLAPFQVEEDETVSIIATFENTGEKDVDSQFKGQVTENGRIVQILESPEITVPEGEEANLTIFFTPSSPGKYIASGRVFYDKKRTFESSVVINALPKGFDWGGLLVNIIYIVIAGAIIFLFYKIRNEKRRLKDRIRQIKYG